MRKKKYRLGKKILLFLILFGALNGSLSLWYYLNIAPKNKIAKLDRKFQKNIFKTKTLFVGHSRIQMGIDDQLFNNSFNYASFGENNVYTYYRVKSILGDRRNKIKRIFFACGFGTFSSLKNPNIVDHAYWNQYLDYFELGKLHNNLDKYLSIYIQSKMFPYSRALQHRLNTKFKFPGANKKELNDLKSNNDKNSYALKAIKRNFINRNCYDDISYVYLKKLISLCKKSNIQLVGIKCPITEYYFSAYSSLLKSNEWDQERFYELMKENDIKILNFEKDFFNQNKLFKDTHHLNEAGKKTFSKLLKNVINNL